MIRTIRRTITQSMIITKASDDNNDGAAACVLGAKRSNHPNWLRHSFRWHKSPEMKGVGLGWAVLSIKP